MNIALMNVRVEVQKNTVTTDKYGNHKNTWEPYLSCYATVSGETPKEETDAGLTVDDGFHHSLLPCRIRDNLDRVPGDLRRRDLRYPRRQPHEF